MSTKNVKKSEPKVVAKPRTTRTSQKKSTATAVDAAVQAPPASYEAVAQVVAAPRVARTSKKKSPETAAVTSIHLETASEQNRSEAEQFYPYDEIAGMAYSFWVSRGGTNGTDVDDWLRAEREVLGKYVQSQSKN